MDAVRSYVERTGQQNEADHEERIRQKHKTRRFEEEVNREDDNQPGNEAFLETSKAKGYRRI
jgi:hypothetical protein